MRGLVTSKRFIFALNIFNSTLVEMRKICPPHPLKKRNSGDQLHTELLTKSYYRPWVSFQSREVKHICYLQPVEMESVQFNVSRFIQAFHTSVEILKIFLYKYYLSSARCLLPSRPNYSDHHQL